MFRHLRAIDWRAAVLTLGALSLVFGCQQRSRPNILLISIDTLRADHLPFYGYARQTAPFLDSLAAEGLVFENALVPLPATDPSHASLFTALHPVEHGVLANSMVLADNAETLAEVLQRSGYATIGAVAVGHLGTKYKFNQGFDVYSGEWEGGREGPRHRRRADEVNQSVFEMLEKLIDDQVAGPFFIFVHYFDVHAPYLKTEAFPVEGPAVEHVVSPDFVSRLPLIDRYDWGIRYVDNYIEELFSRLGTLGLTENLLTVVTSDHGEQLGEHGFAGGHADLYAETIRVPLVIHGAETTPGRVSGVVSSMDIPVSILEYVDLDFSSRVSGRSLFEPGSEQDLLLVLGYPHYTRSVGIIDYPLWFIRNLDHVYRFVGTESIDPAVTEAAPNRIELSPVKVIDGEAVFRIPLAGISKRRSLQPVIVSLDVQLRESACRATASIELEPHMRYLDAEENIEFEKSLRIYYPALLADRTSARISPSECVEKVFFGITEYSYLTQGDSQLPSAIETRLWDKLLTQRKRSSSDELYDLGQDPIMARNLIDSAELVDLANSMRKSSDRLFGGYSEAALEQGQDAGRYTIEEIEMLKSLGYIQ